MRVAVVGSGVSGLVAAYSLAKEGVEVVLYEKDDRIGGHSNTVTVDGMQMDIGFMVFNGVSFPNVIEFFESLGVEMEPCDMSVGVSLDDGQGCEWGTRNGIASLFAQKKNILNPHFWKMIREIFKFHDDAMKFVEKLENNPDLDRNETLDHFVQSLGYSDLFQMAFLRPTCASIWSCSADVMSHAAYPILSFLRIHHILQLFGRPQWLVPKHRSQDYVNKVKKELELRGCQIRTNSQVYSVLTNDEGCAITCKNGSKEVYDRCIIAAHAPDALKMLGEQVTLDESRILGAFQFVQSEIFLHHDNTLMPRNRAAWSSLNVLGTISGDIYMSYWLNTYQKISDTGRPYLLTVSPPHEPEHTLLKWSTAHPIRSVAASKAATELNLIQGKRRIWFCGAYQGYCVHEDGLRAGLIAANGLLGKDFSLLKVPDRMIPSWSEAGARFLLTKFLQRFIAAGWIILLEEGGTVFNFKGTNKKGISKSSLRIHNPRFYWKVVTESDLGLADAYINGDFSLVDKNEGLVNLFMIFFANTELNTCTSSKSSNKRGWWTLVTPIISSGKYLLKGVSRKNTLTSQYLSNELFALFLDETMSYSCALFEDAMSQDLKKAQLRKIHSLIEKARIDKEHHILEIGCGWGSLAIEVVKRSGCKYTGITLSKEQLQYAELQVKAAGLQDRVRFVLSDYRQLPKDCKYDRIISCEMLETEYMEEYFKCCESVLAESGLFVLQFISGAEERYGEFRFNQGLIKDYIFPCGCVPSLSRVTSAAAAASRLCVVHLEDIGSHYYQTLRCWRENLLRNKRNILDLGFDDKFVRTWEYYFDYCAAGFKSRILGNYQIVFTRPGDVAAFGHDPFKPVPST